jgi:hypothetical protein
MISKPINLLIFITDGIQSWALYDASHSICIVFLFQAIFNTLPVFLILRLNINFSYPTKKITSTFSKYSKVVFCQ